MPYLQFIIPKSSARKDQRQLIFYIMEQWFTDYRIEYNRDLAGYEINYHFKNPNELTYFLLTPPELPEKFKIVE